MLQIDKNNVTMLQTNTKTRRRTFDTSLANPSFNTRTEEIVDSITACGSVLTWVALAVIDI